MEKLFKTTLDYPRKICILGLEAWGGMAQHPYALLKALELRPEDREIYFIGLRSGETERIYRQFLYKAGKVKAFLVKYETDPKKKFCRLIFYVYNPFYYYHISRLIKRLDPDLVHYSTGCLIEFVMAAFYNLKVRAKILTFHDPSPHNERNISFLKRINNYLYYCIKKYCLKKIPYLHVNARSHISEIKANFHIPESHIFPTHMVSNIVEDFFKKGTRTSELAALKDSSYTKVLFFGRIRPYKGIEFLVQAVERLLKFHYKVQLILAGEGNIYFDYQSVEDHLILINRYIDNSEIHAIFSVSDIVVLPYVSATQSGIVSLSYYYSKPIIATNVGGIPELIMNGKTGFLVQAGNPHSLEEKMRYLMENPIKMREMGKQAKIYYNRHYSFEALSQELFTIYRTVKAYTTDKEVALQ